MTADLVLTGERTLPGIPHENYWFRRHEAAYRWLEPFTRGAVVIEAGCGEGYGADLFAGSARTVVAVDYDAATAGHARATYPRVNVVRADLQRLPAGAGTVDVVASLQVVEHLWDQPGFLAECARVLRPGGILLITTPNRLTFSPGRDTPLNPFHTRELSAAELVDLLSPAYDVERVLGVRHSPALRAWESRHGSIVDAQLARPTDEWPRQLRRRVGSVTADDFEVAADDVDDSLDLVAVAVRRS